MWLFRDPERKIMLTNEIERQNIPLKNYIYQLEEGHKVIQNLLKNYKKEKRQNEKQIYELEGDLGRIKNLLDISKNLNNKILGQKQNLKDEIKIFKNKAYVALTSVSKYVIETSPLSLDITESTDINNGKLFFVNSIKDVESVITDKLKYKVIDPIGSDRVYESVEKNWKEIVNNENNPMKNKGFIFTFDNKDNPNFESEKVVVRQNKQNIELEKNKIFGQIGIKKATIKIVNPLEQRLRKIVNINKGIDEPKILLDQGIKKIVDINKGIKPKLTGNEQIIKMRSKLDKSNN